MFVTMTDFQHGRVFQQALYLDFTVMDFMKTLTYLKIIIQSLPTAAWVFTMVSHFLWF